MSESPNDLVPERVSHCVVDLLKIINIKHEHQRLLVRMFLHILFDLTFRRQLIVQIRQKVGIRFIRQIPVFFMAAYLADNIQDNDDSQKYENSDEQFIDHHLRIVPYLSLQPLCIFLTHAYYHIPVVDPYRGIRQPETHCTVRNVGNAAVTVCDPVLYPSDFFFVRNAVPQIIPFKNGFRGHVSFYDLSRRVRYRIKSIAVKFSSFDQIAEFVRRII